MLSKNLRPEVSVVIPCKNESTNVRMTVDSILDAPAGVRTELVVVDDASRDGCCNFLQEEKKYREVRLITTAGLGAARARNLGAMAAAGECLIFCDAHVTVPEGWAKNLLGTLNRPGVGAVSPAIGSLEDPSAVGCGQTWDSKLEVVWLPPPGHQPAAAPLLPGGCLAVRAGAFRRVGGFDRGFQVWGHEDVELSLKLWLFGYELYIDPSVKILHLFRQKHPYSVALGHVHYNLLRLACSHFKYERVERVYGMLRKTGQAQKTAAAVLRGGALEQRLLYFSRRKYDDDWFMSKFGINF